MNSQELQQSLLLYTDGKPAHLHCSPIPSQLIDPATDEFEHYMCAIISFIIARIDLRNAITQ